MSNTNALQGDSRSLLDEETLIVDATEAICAAMEEQGITRVELARRIGKTKGFVSHVLSGKRNMTLRTLARMAHALDIKLTVQPTTATVRATLDGYVRGRQYHDPTFLYDVQRAERTPRQPHGRRPTNQGEHDEHHA